MTWMCWIHLYTTQDTRSLIQLKSEDAHSYSVSTLRRKKDAPSLHQPHHVIGAMSYAQQFLVIWITFAV